MNARLTIAAIALLGSLFTAAQNVSEAPQADPVVIDAINAFNNRDKDKPNEITVVLPPIGEPPAPVSQEEPRPTPPAEDTAKSSEPVLVTGKPPEDAGITKAPVPEPAETQTIVPEAEPPKPQPGLAVRVEKLQTGNGAIDPGQIKLLAPFPAKPLSQPPAGWHLAPSESAPPFTRKVELAPGSEITLTIRPHLLVPNADGANVFTIAEPGYEHSLGYGQTATVGAILSNSIRQLEDDSKQLGTAIDSLQQLLISLPKPESQPVDVSKPAPIRKK